LTQIQLRRAYLRAWRAYLRAESFAEKGATGKSFLLPIAPFFSLYCLFMLWHFFSESLILLDWLLEVTFKDFKAIRNFCKSVAVYSNHLDSDKDSLF